MFNLKNMINQTPPDMSMVAGGWNIRYCDIKLEDRSNWPIPIYIPVMKDAGIIKHFLKKTEADEINFFYQGAPQMSPVSVQGMQDIKNETDIGSFRTTSWNPDLADQIWNRLKYIRYNGDNVAGEEDFDEFSATDWWQDRKVAVADSERLSHATYRAVGVSPMLRYMKYRAGGKHAAHYDAGYIYPDTKFRTLKSFVLYFSTNITGATRLIEDGQGHLPVWERNHDDWTEDAKPEQVLFESFPVEGSMLIFNHRMCHSVGTFTPSNPSEQRIIIRGDIIYEAVE